MNPLIEPGIEPLASSLNGLEYVRTVYSCEGHFNRNPDERFLPTAYVTFGVADVGSFAPLYRRLVEVSRSETAVALRLTYDCVLGRFTLSVWVKGSNLDASEKRAVIDAALARLSDAIPQLPAQSFSPNSCDNGGGAMYPCDEPVPPCTMVIPAHEPTCPFA